MVYYLSNRVNERKFNIRYLILDGQVNFTFHTFNNYVLKDICNVFKKRHAFYDIKSYFYTTGLRWQANIRTLKFK